MNNTLPQYTLISVVIILVLTSILVISPYSIMFGLGDSMNPTIENCSVIIVDGSETATQDDIVAFELDDKRVFHRAVEKDTVGDGIDIHYDGFYYTDINIGNENHTIHLLNQEEIPTDGDEVYVMKGDNNGTPDEGLITHNMIEGVVITHYSIPTSIC